MYDFIKGKLIEVSPLKITLEANNIGYKIFIPLRSSSSLPPLNSEITCFLSLVIKEDSHTLYGFITKQERDLFETLITVSGIGPKTALALLGNLEVEQFYDAICNANTTLLHKVPGIGKKTAERLIIELRDKLKVLEKDLLNTPRLKTDSCFSDALSALMHLGYNHFQAQKALKLAMDENKEIKDPGKLISLALKKI